MSSREDMMRRIQQLAFAKNEAELFLDTHPECSNALAFYHQTVRSLDEAMGEYQSSYGPIVAEASSQSKWNWVDGPWPWQMGQDEMNGGKR